MKRFILRAAMAVALVAIASTSTTFAQTVGTEFADVASIPSAGDGEAFATYEANTGNVFFTVGAGIQGFGIRELGGAVIIANVIADTEVALQQIDDSSVAGLTFTPTGFVPGTYNVGNFLPADSSILTAADFLAAYPGSNTAANTGFQSGVNVIPGISTIPEPGALTVLAIAGIGVATRRRR